MTRIHALGIANSYYASLPPFVWYPLAHKILTIPGVLYAGYEWWVRDLIFAVCALPAMMFMLERWRSRGTESVPWRARLHEWRFEILAASLFASYLAAPMNMRSTTLIYHRFLAPAWILAVLTAATRTRSAPPWRLPRLLAAVAPFVPLFTCWPSFVDSDRLYTDLDEATAHMEKRSTYLVLELGPRDNSLLYQPVTAGGHVVALLGGRASFDFTQSPQSPVTQRDNVQWVEIFRRIDGRPYRVIPERTRPEAVSIHPTSRTSDPSVANVVTAALAHRRSHLRASCIAPESGTVLESVSPPSAGRLAGRTFAEKPHPKTLRQLALAVMDKREPPPRASALYRRRKRRKGRLPNRAFPTRYP